MEGMSRNVREWLVLSAITALLVCIAVWGGPAIHRIISRVDPGRPPF